MKVIRETLPDDGIVVDESTQLGYLWYGYPVHQPRRLVSSGFSGTLGYGFPTALGVKVNPDRPVVSVTGDGGFLFGGSDLSTAKQFGINLVTVLVNNASYGNVKRDQERLYEGRHSGAVLHNPDFQAYARSFGVPACGGSRRPTLSAARCARRWPPIRRRSSRSSRTSTRTIRPTSSINRWCPDGQRPTGGSRAPGGYVPDDAWLAKRPRSRSSSPTCRSSIRTITCGTTPTIAICWTSWWPTPAGHNITATVYIDCRSMYRIDEAEGGGRSARPSSSTASRP